MANCEETRQKLLDYIAHTLNQQENSAVEEHLARCVDCRAKLQDILDYSDTEIPTEPDINKKESVNVGSEEKPAGTKKESSGKASQDPDKPVRKESKGKEKKKKPVLAAIFLLLFLIASILAVIKVTSIYTDMAERSQVKIEILNIK